MKDPRDIILAPIVSEKSYGLIEQGVYTFHVHSDASKPEIRAAVEFLFEVKVDTVRVVNQPGKEKRFGRSLGRRQDWKKAYVRLAEGQQIEMGGSERA